jgi:light-regulated signal transduction histidine kinase (bacteriophytochrome)
MNKYEASDSSLHQDRTIGADVELPGMMSCADEPIRIPGSIQPHGFLLGLEIGQEIVVLASENAESFFKTPVKLLLGSTLDLFLDREILASIRNVRDVVDPVGLVTFLGAFRVGEELCSVLTHCVDGRRILEFERQDRLVGPETMNAVMTNFVAILSKMQTEAEVCAAITRQISEITGFDRILLYSFDEVGHGTVLAEANSGTLPSYLDLRFPATDIPTQARALYVQNTVRIIPNAQYDPSPIIGLAGQPTRTLDLSHSVLRSVSPVHLEYMRNMGTMSSMSVSILCEGRLWGLISCHHSEPRLVPFLIRSACDLLTKMVGTQLSAFQTSTKLRNLVKFHDVQRKMMTLIAAENDYLAALFSQIDSLMQITDADGVVLSLDGELHCCGGTPPKSSIRELVNWLNNRGEQEFFQSSHLSAEIPWTNDVTAVASGLLAIRISTVRQRYILWFRQEIVRTVKWAGEPVKTLDAAKHLHPRTSFDSWKETLRGHCIPWGQAEIESAREFRAALNTISLRRAEEEAELGAARFNKLTHTLPIKIFAVTDDGMLSYVNARWTEEGLSSEGIWYEGGRLVQEDSDRCAAAWKAGVEDETEFEEEVRFIRQSPNGGPVKEVWNLIHIVPFRRKDAGRAGWIGASIDLTERKHRENALRVTDKLALTTRMTSFFAHEINNPLEAVTNLLFLLKGRAATDQDALGYLDLLDNEFERISGTVKQTLRWTEENSDKVSRITAGEVFTDAVRLFAAKIRNRNVQVAFEGEQDIQLFGIVSQLRQVVAHLLSNAIDAVPLGGLVTLRALQSGDEIELIVEDRGSGIHEADQELIFQPFFSTKGDLGNGLGLYISREIVDRHKGTMKVESAIGQGTVVRVCLPTSGEEGAPSAAVLNLIRGKDW